MATEILKKYLNAFSDPQVTLIGPLYNDKCFESEPVLYIDRGADFRATSGGISIGDGDSANSSMDILLPKEKNFSDLAFALRNLPENFSHIRLLGFLGGRRDHELLNLGEVHHFLVTRELPCQVQFDDSLVVIFKNRIEIQLNCEFTTLVFQDAKVEISGQCAYPYVGPLAAVSSHGLSNRGFGAVAFASHEAPLFIFKT